MERYPNLNILLNLPEDYIPKAEFVFRTFCYILRLNPKFIYGTHFDAAHIYYGPPPKRDYPIRIIFDEATAPFFQRKELYPLEEVRFRAFKGMQIPFLFSPGGEIFSFLGSDCIIRKDIIASGFYFLTCWHEYVISEQGIEPGRVDYRQSLQYRWDFCEIPVVDIYCQILQYGILRSMPEFIRDIAWAQDKRFAISLSHDIDYWQFWDDKSLRDILSYNLKSFYKRPVRALYKAIGHLIHKKIFYDGFKLLSKVLSKEKDLGASSTWFIMASKSFDDHRQNYITDLSTREQIVDLLGQEDVGLHGSPSSAFDYDVLVSELDALKELGFQPLGFRTHYLNFDYQKSFAILEKAGISYDSTLGYWENIGFRAGISFPFYPFNIAENRPFKVLEIPLIVMDTTLNSPKAMAKSVYSARLSLRRLINIAAQYQSHLTLLWHNTTFDPIDYPFWGRLYWQTIRYALNHKGWISSLKDIYEEWVTHSY